MSYQEVPWQFAILCIITQCFRRAPVNVACSVTLLQSKRPESAAPATATATATGAAGALILHWQSGIVPLPRLEPVMNSLSQKRKL